MANGKKPPCEHWEECSGCPLIRFDYKKQLLIKEDKVKKAFLDEGFDPQLLKKILKTCRPSPKTLAYRNKAKWVLDRDANGKIQMGIYRTKTHDIVDIPRCTVHAPEINDLSTFIMAELDKHKVALGSKDVEKPSLRYLIVRYSFREKKLLCVFVTTKAKVPGLAEVYQAIVENYVDKVVAIVQNINSGEGNVLLGEANSYHYKAGELSETMGSLRVPVGPLSFLQVNSSQATYLYHRVKQLIGPGPFQSGLDLYSGVGLMAMHLAPVTKRILAVEEVGAAALEAITAARRNRVHNVLQLSGDSGEGIQTFHNEWGAPDWVVLNPPRRGCEESVLRNLATRPPAKLVYVSCNPVSLARDLHLLTELVPSFEVKTLEPVDMFPQTDHVECIALLENREFKRKPKKSPKASKASKGQMTRQQSKTLH